MGERTSSPMGTSIENTRLRWFSIKMGDFWRSSNQRKLKGVSHRNNIERFSGEKYLWNKTSPWIKKNLRRSSVCNEASFVKKEEKRKPFLRNKLYMELNTSKQQKDLRTALRREGKNKA